MLSWIKECSGSGTRSCSQSRQAQKRWAYQPKEEADEDSAVVFAAMLPPLAGFIVKSSGDGRAILGDILTGSGNVRANPLQDKVQEGGTHPMLPVTSARSETHASWVSPADGMEPIVGAEKTSTESGPIWLNWGHPGGGAIITIERLLSNDVHHALFVFRRSSEKFGASET